MRRARYLISFPDGAMDHIPEEEMPEVGDAAHAVARAAKEAGVLVFAGGLQEDVDPVLVAADETVSAGTYPETRTLSGGFVVVDVPSREEALVWAASSRPPAAVRKRSDRSGSTRTCDRSRVPCRPGSGIRSL
jgi:hypothetical protein